MVYVYVFPAFVLLIAYLIYRRFMATVQDVLDGVAALKVDVQALKDEVTAGHGAASQAELDAIAAAIADVHALAKS